MTDYGIRHGEMVTSLHGVSAAATGDKFALPPQIVGDPGVVTWSYEISGGPPATIEVRLMGSIDGVVPYILDSSVTVGPIMRHVLNKLVRFVWLELVSIGAGGGTVLGRIYIA